MRENSESSVACHHRVGFMGLLITLGIVFGDIGTSPLCGLTILVDHF